MPDRQPYRNIRFLLEIDSIAIAGFSTCNLPENSTEVVEYREGNDPPTSQKLWSTNDFGNLSLEKGVTDDSIALYEWRKLVEQGKLGEARRSIAVVILDEEGEAGPRYEFKNAWVRQYDAPDLDAGGSDVAVESLEIVHEGMERTA
jgi:phage tail-like protein